METGDKFMSESDKTFVQAGGKKASTVTYPKSGQEQSATISQGPWHDRPRGNAVTVTYAKNGQQQSL